MTSIHISPPVLASSFVVERNFSKGASFFNNFPWSCPSKNCVGIFSTPGYNNITILHWVSRYWQRLFPVTNESMCQQISFTNAKTLDENCLSVDQNLNSHPAPWCSSTPHILWIRRPIQVKCKHEHKTGQCAPIHLHSTQNDAA